MFFLNLNITPFVDLQPNISVGVSKADREGPLSSQVQRFDKWTYISWIALLIFLAVDAVSSKHFQSLMACLQASHEHLE